MLNDLHILDRWGGRNFTGENVSSQHTGSETITQMHLCANAQLSRFRKLPGFLQTEYSGCAIYAHVNWQNRLDQGRVKEERWLSSKERRSVQLLQVALSCRKGPSVRIVIRHTPHIRNKYRGSLSLNVNFLLPVKLKLPKVLSLSFFSSKYFETSSLSLLGSVVAEKTLQWQFQVNSRT